MVKWNFEYDGCSAVVYNGAGAANNLESFFHIMQSIAVAFVQCRVEAYAVIGYGNGEILIYGKFNIYIGSLRMFHHVVQRFFYRQQDIAPYFSADGYFVDNIGHSEMQVHVQRLKIFYYMVPQVCDKVRQ